jgi:hypothetical protein
MTQSKKRLDADRDRIAPAFARVAGKEHVTAGASLPGIGAIAAAAAAAGAAGEEVGAGEDVAAVFDGVVAAFEKWGWIGNWVGHVEAVLSEKRKARER